MNISPVLMLCVMAVAGNKSSREARLRMVFVDEEAPEWCEQTSSVPLPAAEFETTVEALFVQALTDGLPAVDLNPPLRYLAQNLVQGDEPIFVVTDPQIDSGKTRFQRRVRVVKSFDGLTGKRWQLRIRARRAGEQAASEVSLSWGRVRDPSVQQGRASPRGKNEAAQWNIGSQGYCAVRNGTEIVVSLIGTADIN
jgi:hypothetical protein